MKIAHLTLICLVFGSPALAKRGPPPGLTPVGKGGVTQKFVDKVTAHLETLIVGRMAPQVLRLVFHDCVDGCDGCLNRASLANSGIPGPDNPISIMDVIDHTYAFLWADSGLSLTDVYVLAGVVAVRHGIKNNNEDCDNPQCFVPEFDVPFEYGRPTCQTSPLTDDLRPFASGHVDTEEFFKFYQKQWGHNFAEAVAFMGAHTMGRATGFLRWRGFWTGNANEALKFNNNYFKALTELNYEQVIAANVTGFERDGDFFQWEAKGDINGETEKFTMLNVDIATIKDFDQRDGRSSCAFQECEDSQGLGVARFLARSNPTFIRLFASAWNKMVRTGFTDLKTPAP